MEDSILSAYSEARTEYMRQLLMHVSPVYFNFFLKLYDTAKNLTQYDTKKRLWQFQTLLAEIPDWNMERVRTETSKIEKDCDCDYLEDLLTAVFLAYTKVLTAIRLNTKNKRVNITIPKIDHFLFKALCETSKILWQNTFLFREDVSNLQRQQNYREVEKLINEGITQTVRTMTPVRSILKDCITDIDEHNDDSHKPDTESTVIQENTQFPNMNEIIQEQSNIEDTNKTVEEDSTGQHSTGQDSQAVQQETGGHESGQESQPEQQTEAQSIQAVEEKVIDVSGKEPSVKFTNYNTIYTIDEPENTDIKYADPDLESVHSFETDDSEDSLEFEDDDSNSIDAETIDDKSVEELSSDDFSTLN
jgi:hypothetical protein